MPVRSHRARTLARIVACLTALVLSGGGVTVARAQSLGDLAKQEEQRRKAVKPSKKVYTNSDLGPDGTRPTPPAGQTLGPGGQDTGDTPEPAQAPSAPKVDDPGEPELEKTEEYWRGRIEAARADLQRNELFADALQSRINALSTDFVNRDDPAQRGMIAEDRLRALAELERVQDTIAKLRQQILDIEEEARRAGIPPGWIR